MSERRKKAYTDHKNDALLRYKDKKKRGRGPSSRRKRGRSASSGGSDATKEWLGGKDSDLEAGDNDEVNRPVMSTHLLPKGVDEAAVAARAAPTRTPAVL